MKIIQNTAFARAAVNGKPNICGHGGNGGKTSTNDEKRAIVNAILETGIDMLIDIAKECDNYLTVTRISAGEKWKITVENITEGEIQNEN